jgi:hypothetical protein
MGISGLGPAPQKLAAVPKGIQVGRETRHSARHLAMPLPLQRTVNRLPAFPNRSELFFTE